MPEVGDVLSSKYRLLRRIGKGGMGEVFEALHEEIGKHVAIKLLHAELAKNQEVVARFTREARAASAIGHPSIIDIHDFGRIETGELFMVMEYLQGQNLGELLKKVDQFDINDTIFVMCEVLTALHSAHQCDIIHRDLKPENIFLVDAGRAMPQVKLLDFGISKVVDRSKPNEKLTATGIILGTPYYMAPEQAKGQQDMDHRVDLYAMGVILFKTLTGKVPFAGGNSIELLFAILRGKPPQPRSIRPEIPEELEKVILKAMRDRENRYQTALEMFNDLLPFLDERGKDVITLPKGMHLDTLKRAAFGQNRGSTGSIPVITASEERTRGASCEGAAPSSGPEEARRDGEGEEPAEETAPAPPEASPEAIGDPSRQAATATATAPPEPAQPTVEPAPAKPSEPPRPAGRDSVPAETVVATPRKLGRPGPPVSRGPAGEPSSPAPREQTPSPSDPGRSDTPHPPASMEIPQTIVPDQRSRPILTAPVSPPTRSGYQNPLPGEAPPEPREAEQSHPPPQAPVEVKSERTQPGHAVVPGADPGAPRPSAGDVVGTDTPLQASIPFRPSASTDSSWPSGAATPSAPPVPQTVSRWKGLIIAAATVVVGLVVLGGLTAVALIYFGDEPVPLSQRTNLQIETQPQIGPEPQGDPQGGPEPPAPPGGQVLTNESALQLAQQYYTTEGQFAGQFSFTPVRCRLVQTDPDNAEAHIEYQYHCQSGQCEGYQYQGTDQRIFYLQRQGGQWRVTGMAESNSAQL